MKPKNYYLCPVETFYDSTHTSLIHNKNKTYACISVAISCSNAVHNSAKRNINNLPYYMYNIIQLNDKDLSELQIIAKELGIKKQTHSKRRPCL